MPNESHWRVTAAAVVILSLAFGQEGRAGAEGCSLSPREVFAAVSPSVVPVFSLSIDPFLVNGRVLPRFGTGFILGDGYVATNYHVVADAEQTTVYFGDFGMPAQVMGIDPTLDVAVVWTANPGKALDLADSGELEIGQDAFAIGYPLGLGQTISAGIVSGVGRVLPEKTSNWLSPYIQTDAAVNPGNSGGPLVDACGRVIGMITSKAPEADNVGFAIPSNVLGPVIGELIEKGHVTRAWHGLYGRMTTPQIVQIIGSPLFDWYSDGPGFLVETIEPGSAADRAGLIGGQWPVRWGGTEILVGGDIITHVDGRRIDTLEAALEAVGNLSIGATVELQILRGDLLLTKTIDIEERPILEREMELYR